MHYSLYSRLSSNTRSKSEGIPAVPNNPAPPKKAVPMTDPEDEITFGQLMANVYGLRRIQNLKYAVALSLPTVRVEHKGNRTYWATFQVTADRCMRDPNLLIAFFRDALGAPCSAGTVRGSMVLHGIFTRKQIEEALIRFIRTFVLCPSRQHICKVAHMRRGPLGAGVLELKCPMCGNMSYSVPAPRMYIN
jgi:translation initiation factor 2 beta subunit (eIF-2beta)/eIF-5